MVSPQVQDESCEDIVRRHAKEMKDLLNKIQSMKANMKKSNRKSITDNCISLLKSLEKQHIQELAGDQDVQEVSPESLLEQLSLEAQVEAPAVAAVSSPQERVPTRKRNRQKEKLAKRQQELDRIKQEALEEASNQPNFKELEQELIDSFCVENRFKPVDIKPDGHCLFASVLDQLTLSNLLEDTNDSVIRLRSLACQYILSNKDDFIPFMFDEATGDLKDIEEYCSEMVETAKWGGELELLALAKSMNVKIKVLLNNLNDNSIKFHTINDQEESLPELRLVYYKHTYALGEHYNSLQPL